MNRHRGTPWLLAWASMWVGGAMAASPRAAPEYYVPPIQETREERRSRRLAEMEAALGRLVGRFGLERPWVFAAPPLPPNAPRIMMDCMAIGEGKGVSCVLLTFLPQALPAGRAGAGKKPGAEKPLGPSGSSIVSSFTEYGLDPNALRVRLMTVDRGSAVLMFGRVWGNMVIIRGRCWNSAPDCEIQQRMTASADGEDIQIINYTNWVRGPVYTLRRLSQEEADKANWNLEGAPPRFPSKPGRPR